MERLVQGVFYAEAPTTRGALPRRQPEEASVVTIERVDLVEIEAEPREVVVVRPVFAARVHLQPSLEPCHRLRSERPVDAPEHTPYDSDRVANQIRVAHVRDLGGLYRRLCRRESIVDPRRSLHDPARQDVIVDLFREHVVKGSQEAARGRNHLPQIPMDPHDMRVGIDTQQSVHRDDVSGALQQPVATGALPLQEL